MKLRIETHATWILFIQHGIQQFKVTSIRQSRDIWLSFSTCTRFHGKKGYTPISYLRYMNLFIGGLRKVNAGKSSPLGRSVFDTEDTSSSVQSMPYNSTCDRTWSQSMNNWLDFDVANTLQHISARKLTGRTLNCIPAPNRSHINLGMVCLYWYCPMDSQPCHLNLQQFEYYIST